MVIIYGPKWLWAEMVMGRYCHGPKWLWAEMTSYQAEVVISFQVLGLVTQSYLKLKIKLRPSKVSLRDYCE